MREILFRGKRVDNGEWVEGDLIQDRDLGQMMIEYFDYYTDENGRQRDYCQYDVVPETVGQYTGLTDKNGTKIFEGDIVKLDEYVKQTFDVEDGIVLYGRGGFHVKEFGLRNSLNVIASADWVLRGEVIGNIYEQGVQ